MLRGRLSPSQLKPLLPYTQYRCISSTLKRFQEEVDPLADFQNGVLPERESQPRQQIRQRSKIAFRRSEKPVRTLFYVPGSSLKMLEKAWQLEPDNIVIKALVRKPSHTRRSILKILSVLLKRK